MGFQLCKNCSEIQELENRRDLYTPALGPFSYHIKGKCQCLYQFLINLTLSIFIRQIFEVLKQRLEWIQPKTTEKVPEKMLTEYLHKNWCNAARAKSSG